MLGILWLVLRRTRFGVLVRAATEDREMVAALGVDQKWLFTGVFALGVFLAGLGGALQLPRDAVGHAMDLNVIVEAFVVVVIGGLGSVPGAFVAAVLVAELNAFGILILPGVSLVLAFLVMAAVLVVRPFGLFGRPEPQPRPVGLPARPWHPLARTTGALALLTLALLAALPLVAGPYALAVAAEIAVFALFALSLQFLMSVGGLVSFGHAAFFGLGAYGAAFAVGAGLPMPVALLAGTLFAALGAVPIGWFSVRLFGVYLAMLTLAFAQILWSTAFQWVALTGGDNGILGLWPQGWAGTPAGFFLLTLGLLVAGLLLLRRLAFAPYGYALRAARDAPTRAAAVGIDVGSVRWAAFVAAGAVAGLAGALFAFLKGSVFPDSLAIPLSIDALVMVLLGGVGTVSGALIGAVAYKSAAIWLMRETDLSKLVLGALIVVLVVAFPNGIAGTLAGLLARWRRA